MASYFWGADPILKIVEKSKARKADADLRLRYYHSCQTEDLAALIKARWSSPEDFRLFFINIVRKIVDKRAAVYVDAPYRNFEGMSQDVGAAIYAAAGANTIFKKANRLTKLCKTACLQVGWNGSRITLSTVTPNILDVVYDDPENPTRILVTHPGERYEDTTYSDWTATTWQRLDYRGRAIPITGNPSGVNPYGVLPFVPLFDHSPDDQFFLRGGDDLIEAQRAINVALVNLWRAIELQSHGQAWASGMPTSEFLELLKTGPNQMINLPENGKFGFAAPETPIEGVLKGIEFLIKQTAVANDLAANVFELNPRAESGAAKQAESRDLIEARADDVELWRVYETRAFDIIKRVVNTHQPGTIPEAARISVDFGDMPESLADTARLNNYQQRLDLGIWSPVDVLIADNPDIRSREDAMKLLQKRREEASVLGAAFAGPTFEENNDRST